jgi:hypothetical protein
VFDGNTWLPTTRISMCLSLAGTCGPSTVKWVTSGAWCAFELSPWRLAWFVWTLWFFGSYLISRYVAHLLEHLIGTPSAKFQVEVDAAKEAAGWERLVRPLLSLHVRHGDTCRLTRGVCSRARTPPTCRRRLLTVPGPPACPVACFPVQHPLGCSYVSAARFRRSERRGAATL